MCIVPPRLNKLACIACCSYYGKNTYGGPRGKVVVPEAYLSTPSVLIMEYIPGKKLEDALKDHFDTVARERGMTIDELR